MVVATVNILKNHWTVYFKSVNFMICELCLSKAITKKSQVYHLGMSVKHWNMNYCLMSNEPLFWMWDWSQGGGKLGARWACVLVHALIYFQMANLEVAYSRSWLVWWKNLSSYLFCSYIQQTHPCLRAFAIFLCLGHSLPTSSHGWLFLAIAIKVLLLRDLPCWTNQI